MAKRVRNDLAFHFAIASFDTWLAARADDELVTVLEDTPDGSGRIYRASYDSLAFGLHPELGPELQNLIRDCERAQTTMLDAIQSATVGVLLALGLEISQVIHKSETGAVIALRERQ